MLTQVAIDTDHDSSRTLSNTMMASSPSSSARQNRSARESCFSRPSAPTSFSLLSSTMMRRLSISASRSSRWFVKRRPRDEAKIKIMRSRLLEMYTASRRRERKQSSCYGYDSLYVWNEICAMSHVVLWGRQRRSSELSQVRFGVSFVRSYSARSEEGPPRLTPIA